MRFDELNEKNHLMFAIKFYENPHSVTLDDFMEDMKKFKYLKRLLNHLIVLFNVFGEGTLPLLMYKLEREYWSVLKTFCIYLNRYKSGGTLDLIEIDSTVKAELDRL